MAVKREDVARYVAELGLPEEQTNTLISTLMANEHSATQFVGQRLRHDDYTHKTQALGEEKKGIEQRANEQITAYAQQLHTAQERIERIMTDLEKSNISAATANSRLLKVKEKFNLGDEDIPALPVPDPAGTQRPAANGGTVDIDKKLEEFKGRLFKEMMPEMLSVMNFMPKFSDIAEQHKELTGKRLTQKEFAEITSHAREKKMSFEQAWEDKFDIGTARTNRRDEENKKKWQQEWEDEQRKKRSDEALAGVRPTEASREYLMSPVLRKKFNETDPGVRPQPDKSPAPQQQAQPQQAGPKLSGAERAAVRFQERRAAGIPMGAPTPVK